MTTCEYVKDKLDIENNLEFEEIIKFNKTLNKSMVYSIVKFVSYLRNKGFVIPTSSTISFCQMLNNFDLIDKKQYFLISKSLFCSSRLEYDSYENLFNRFFSFDELEGLGLKLNDKIKRSNEEIQQMQKELSKEVDEKSLEIAKEAMELTKKIFKSKFKAFTVHENNLSNLKEEDISEIGNLIKSLNLNEEESKFLKSLVLLDRQGIEEYLLDKKFNVDKAGDMLEKMMLLNFDNKNLDTISEVLIASSGSLHKIDSEYRNINKKINAKITAIKREAEKSIDSIKKEHKNDISKLKMKISTLTHRDEYSEGYNAVIEVVNNCDKTISKLSKTEYSYLRYYIKLNASKFRTRIGRSMKQYKSKTFDIKKTVQESIKFNGSPIQYYYKKPVVKKYKLVCVLDISGSVSKYLELLLAFFFEISSVFNGGVEFYGFVSSLIDFTDVFKNGNLEDVVESLKGHRGYSNYGKAIRDFYESSYRKIDANTIILYFGDARNNKNDSNSNILEKINDKVKYSVWLNPEEEHKWDSGDSVMGDYAKVTDSIYCVNEVKQLIDFLNDFSIIKSEV